jgi:hypothetical protein
VLRQLPKSLSNPESWVLTGTNGLYAYPRGEEQSVETVKESIAGAAKLIVQALVRTILGV